MKGPILVSGEKYRGRYVALNSFNSQKVVASGIEPACVYKSAEEKGLKSPVIVYMPEKNVTHIY